MFEISEKEQRQLLARQKHYDCFVVFGAIVSATIALFAMTQTATALPILADQQVAQLAHMLAAPQLDTPILGQKMQALAWMCAAMATMLAASRVFASTLRADYVEQCAQRGLNG